MPSLQRPYNRAVCAVLAAVLCAAAAALVLVRSGAASAATTGQLQQQISSGQSQISGLAGAVSAASGQLAQLTANIHSLEHRLGSIQADLDARRLQLLKLRSELDAARTRLAQLVAFETKAEGVLSQQLVSNYENDRPDLVSVVLEARGFQDLLEQISFATRIRKQSVKVVAAVKRARRAVAAEATRLGALEVRQQALTEQVLAQRNALAGVRVSLVRQQIAVAQRRDVTAGQLASVRGRVGGLEHQLAQLQAAQAAAAARAAAAAAAASGASSATSGGGSLPSGPVSGAGGFAFPLPKGSVSPPGTWTPDDGVDMAAPGDTPEYAVCSGTIVLHGIGGFGPWAPVLHCDSPIAGYSYVYYGHAGPQGQLPVGTHVSAGQVMSSIGPGIVGMSTGPHIEIGFSDGSGTPLGPGTAGAMMSLLQSAYGG